jgi:hypothetical protein
MTSVINELVRSVLQKNSLQDCSLHELEQLTQRYPYFATPHLLLARKLKEVQTGNSDTHLQKATLYFPDPLWINHLLNENGNAVIEQKQYDINNVTANPVITPDPAHEHEMEEQPTVLMEIENGAEIPTLPASDSVIEIDAKQAADIIAEEVIEPPVSPGSIAQDEEVDQVAQEDDTEIPTLPATESYTEPSSFNPDESNTTEDHRVLASNGSLNHDHTEELAIVATEAPEENNQSENEHEPLMEIPSLKIEPIDAATAELSFQPYHTVDYFASQGIKVRDDEKPKDKFGQQLKSFTEWLKILKKVPVTEIATAVGTQSEKKVEQLAEHSVSEREVVTEAMAEVWVKQGNPEKAITIYRKLSLLNPSKSSYFAGLIEQLKNS